MFNNETSEPYMAVRLGYDLCYMLPMEDALTLAKLITKAKKVKIDYSGSFDSILEKESEQIQITVIPQQVVKEYLLSKTVEPNES
jgi:hypothetical protein